jgi:hypothetical protein
MTLKGFNSVFDSTLNNDIQDNLVEYFDWELLNKGNYFNITLGETVNGIDYSRLKVSTSDNFTKGKAWDGFKKGWVWQSGVGYSPVPIVGSDISKPGISGVYVNDTFYPSSTSGTYAHYIDYYNGRVIFDTPIPTGSKVQVEHSYRWISVEYANSLPWIRQLQENSLNPEGFLENNATWDLPPDVRLQLPIIAIEIVPLRMFKGYQLGGGQWVMTDVLFHCIAEDEPTRNKLVDIVSLQNNALIQLFDTNKMSQASGFPLDYRGYPVSGAKIYPDLLSSYGTGSVRLINGMVSTMKAISSNIYGGVVRFTTEGIKLNI